MAAVRVLRWVLRVVGLTCILVCGLLFKGELDRFQAGSQHYPAGSTMAGLPVGQLEREQARQRLEEAYQFPIELSCDGAEFQAAPAELGFSLDTDGMLADADRQLTVFSWQGFWDYFQGGMPAPIHIALKYDFNEAALHSYLTDRIAPRCGMAPQAAFPYPGTLNFIPGQEGATLQVEAALAPIEKAAQTLDRRTIELPMTRLPALPASVQNLETFLKQTIRLAGYNGVAGVYLADLQSGQDFTFVLNQGGDVEKPEDVAFTGASTIKIPIMISVMRRAPDSPDAATTDRLQKMIGFSNNDASDWLMKNLLDPVRGPLKVTEDMRSLGLKNTFLAGFFALHSPLLERYVTPGNSRTDLSTDPDLYNQVNPAEIGGLLKDLYQCAEGGKGELVKVFTGEITQAKCQVMVKYLQMDRLPYMIQYGLPDGTVIAHKHGWVSDAQNVIHDMSDAAIVYTPNGNYVLTVYLYKADLLVFDDGNKLVGDLSKAVYNYFAINNSNYSGR
jgi:beta-lactamase class A